MRILKGKNKNMQTNKTKQKQKNYTPAFESFLTAVAVMMSMASMTVMAAMEWVVAL